jgi:hypothetical protein
MLLPLDYILGTIGKPKSSERKKKNKNILKNIVFERCLEVRLIKSKPKLKDILKKFKQNPQYTKQHIIKMLNVLYSNS